MEFHGDEDLFSGAMNAGHESCIVQAAIDPLQTQIGREFGTANAELHDNRGVAIIPGMVLFVLSTE